MSPLRSIARWSAGPAIGITLGLILGTLADGPAAPPARLTLRILPPASLRLAEGPRPVPLVRPRPGWTVLAAAGD